MAMSACSIRTYRHPCFARIDGHADTAGHEKFLGAEHDRLGDRIHHPLHDLRRQLLLAVFGDDDDEFVARQARHGVGVAQGRAQARRHRHQEHVAGLVAHAVVDELEAVEVDQHDPHRVAAAVRIGHGLAEAVLQQRAVRQAGQRVVLGHVVHALLGELAFGDVAAGAAVAGELAELVEDGLAVDQEPARLAVVVEHLVFEIVEGLVRVTWAMWARPFSVSPSVGTYSQRVLPQQVLDQDAGFFGKAAGDHREAELRCPVPSTSPRTSTPAGGSAARSAARPFRCVRARPCRRPGGGWCVSGRRCACSPAAARAACVRRRFAPRPPSSG
jgi:hypothetical protein